MRTPTKLPVREHPGSAGRNPYFWLGLGAFAPMRARGPPLPSLRMSRRLAFALPALCIALVAGCGGGSDNQDPVERVPAKGGLRERVRAAQSPDASAFPAADGKTLQQVADGVGAQGPDLAMAPRSSRPANNRLAFGVIDQTGSVRLRPDRRSTSRRRRTRPPRARTPRRPTCCDRGPVPLQAGGDRAGSVRRRLRGAGAVRQAGQVVRAGRHARAAASRSPRRAQIEVIKPAAGPDPRRRRAGAEGRDRHDRVAPRATSRLIDTRAPPQRHARATSPSCVGKKPVALLFATPQLCQSRVCGPVTDMALQLQGQVRRQDGLHPPGGLRGQRPEQGPAPAAAGSSTCRPSRGCSSSTSDGKITARLEGSFGVNAFENALKTAL